MTTAAGRVARLPISLALAFAATSLPPQALAIAADPAASLEGLTGNEIPAPGAMTR